MGNDAGTSPKLSRNFMNFGPLTVRIGLSYYIEAYTPFIRSNAALCMLLCHAVFANCVQVTERELTKLCQMI